MKIWNFFTDWLDGEPCADIPQPPIGMDVNPANGLPMIEDTCLDIEGNVYGTSHWNDVDSLDNSNDWSGDSNFE